MTFGEDLLDPDTRETYNTSNTGFPFTDPIAVAFQNQNPNKSSVFVEYNVYAPCPAPPAAPALTACP